MASGKVTNVKLRLIKPLDFHPEFKVGQVFEPFAYRDHDMNRSPLGYTVLYFSRSGKKIYDAFGDDTWCADLTDFEDATV